MNELLKFSHFSILYEQFLRTFHVFTYIHIFHTSYQPAYLSNGVGNVHLSLLRKSFKKLFTRRLTQIPKSIDIDFTISGSNTIIQFSASVVGVFAFDFFTVARNVNDAQVQFFSLTSPRDFAGVIRMAARIGFAVEWISRLTQPSLRRHLIPSN